LCWVFPPTQKQDVLDFVNNTTSDIPKTQIVDYPAIVPSKEQELIFNHLLSSSEGHIRIEAVAGAGKTTTLIEAIRRILLKAPPNVPLQILLTCFNRKVAEELAVFKTMECSRAVKLKAFSELLKIQDFYKCITFLLSNVSSLPELREHIEAIFLDMDSAPDTVTLDKMNNLLLFCSPCKRY